MGFVARKRQQIDNLMEMPKEKRPPERMIWWGKPEEIEDWIEKVYNIKESSDNEVSFVIRDEDIG